MRAAGRSVAGEKRRKMPIPTGLGVKENSGRSHHPRERISGKCPAAVQAQGATGRHHQGDQEAQLLHEAWREAPGQGSTFAEATAQEAAAGIGISQGAAFLGGPPFRSPRGSAQSFRESGPRKAERLGSCYSFVPAGPRDPRPASPDTGLLKHLGSQVQSLPNLLPHTGPGESGSWNTTTRC